MRKIRFRDVKKAIIEDYKSKNKKWPEYFYKPFMNDIKSCHCTDDIILVLEGLGFKRVEAFDFIIDLITTR